MRDGKWFGFGACTLFSHCDVGWYLDVRWLMAIYGWNCTIYQKKENIHAAWHRVVNAINRNREYNPNVASSLIPLMIAPVDDVAVVNTHQLNLSPLLCNHKPFWKELKVMRKWSRHVLSFSFTHSLKLCKEGNYSQFLNLPATTITTTTTWESMYLTYPYSFTSCCCCADRYQYYRRRLL